MKRIFYKSVPFCKEDVALALESGVDGLIVPAETAAQAASMARCEVLAAEDALFLSLKAKSDEERAAASLQSGRFTVLTDWEIIPVENLLAGCGAELLALEVSDAQSVRVAGGILEKGVENVVAAASALPALKSMAAALKYRADPLSLSEAEVLEIRPAGMGHRVCVDTLTVLKSGQGMLVGNSAAFTVLVNAETEHNEYVASRPFRVNAGSVHAYAVLPGDRTCYLQELAAGDNVLIVDKRGESFTATVGRVKVEQRPMLLLRLKAGEAEGAVFLQNAETIRLVRPDGTPVGIVELKPGDRVLCRLDAAGRHFGMRITEDIREG